MTLDESNQMNPCTECGGDCRNPVSTCPDYGWELSPKTLPGATLADTRGQRRVRKLWKRSGHIDEQIAELQERKDIIENEILDEEWDPDRLGVMVDRQDLGAMSAEGWLR